MEYFSYVIMSQVGAMGTSHAPEVQNMDPGDHGYSVLWPNLSEVKTLRKWFSIGCDLSLKSQRHGEETWEEEDRVTPVESQEGGLRLQCLLKLLRKFCQNRGDSGEMTHPTQVHTQEKGPWDGINLLRKCVFSGKGSHTFNKGLCMRIKKKHK